MKAAHWTTTLVVLTIVLVTTLFLPSSGIGINYGTNGNNLPNPTDVINLCRRCGISLIRLFEPNHNILDALRHSGLRVTIGVKNEDLQSLAKFNDPTAAKAWLNTNIMPYKNDISFQYITLGNEVIPGPLSTIVAQIMNNMYIALKSLGLGDIKVTTVVPTSVLETNFPPSAGKFSSELIGVMGPIISFLYGVNSPLMVNVYPYFSYAADHSHISLEYATFQATNPVVVDGEFKYYNLFDATVDTFHAAIEKVNTGNIGIAISESGWPSAGNEPYASQDNARVYNMNLEKHVTSKGTPKRPKQIMDTFIFAMFNENQKQGAVEQNFGIFYPNMEPVYHLFRC